MLQLMPQLTPSHVGVALAVAVHAVHDVPHDAGSELLTHMPPQRWNPVSHVKPQLEPSHVALACIGGAAHGTHIEPQVPTELLLTHVPPHA